MKSLLGLKISDSASILLVILIQRLLAVLYEISTMRLEAFE